MAARRFLNCWHAEPFFARYPSATPSTTCTLCAGQVGPLSYNGITMQEFFELWRTNIAAGILHLARERLRAGAALRVPRVPWRLRSTGFRGPAGCVGRHLSPCAQPVVVTPAKDADAEWSSAPSAASRMEPDGVG